MGGSKRDIACKSLSTSQVEDDEQGDTKSALHPRAV